MTTLTTENAHVVELDDGTRTLYRSRRVARAYARAVVREWLALYPGERERGTWRERRKTVGSRWLILLELRGGSARRMWEAEERRVRTQEMLRDS